MEPAAEPFEQQLADQLYDQVRKSIDTKTITAASLINIAVTAMVSVEVLGVTSGPQKKALVLHVVGRLADELPATTSAERADKAAVKNAVILLGPTIDMIVAASKGEVAINVGGGPAPAPAGSKCCAIC